MRKAKVDTKTESAERLKDAHLKVKAENRNLRKENKSLKREIARLRKETHRIEGLKQEAQAEVDLQEAEKLLPWTVDVDEVYTELSLTCPKCGSHDILAVAAGTRTIEVCQSCGGRRSKKVPIDILD